MASPIVASSLSALPGSSIEVVRFLTIVTASVWIVAVSDGPSV